MSTMSLVEMKQYMDSFNIKQNDIAKKADCSPAAVSLVLNGKSRSKRICDIIETTIKNAEKEQTNESTES